jgi:hypothetical protein
MPLKTVALKTSTTAGAKNGTDVPSFVIENDGLRRYAEAIRAKRAAEAEIAELEPTIKADATHRLFIHNIAEPMKPVATVRLTDREGTSVRVSFQDRYSIIANVEAVDELMKSLGKDINDYVQQRAGAKFDDAVFVSKVGEDKGEFSKRIYDAYRKSAETVTAELIKRGYLPEGTACPLSTFEKVTVREGFHQTRWAAFPKVGDQEKVTEVVKNTITATVE